MLDREPRDTVESEACKFGGFGAERFRGEPWYLAIEGRGEKRS
jgi:hypothetical protein